jgi:hypothetical protein
MGLGAILTDELTPPNLREKPDKQGCEEERKT